LAAFAFFCDWADGNCLALVVSNRRKIRFVYGFQGFPAILAVVEMVREKPERVDCMKEEVNDIMPDSRNWLL